MAFDVHDMTACAIGVPVLIVVVAKIMLVIVKGDRH